MSPEIRDIWKRLYRFRKRHPSLEIRVLAATLASNLVLLDARVTVVGLRAVAEQRDALADAVRGHRGS